MDEVPVSMAIAQAAKETGWGTSRFAQEGNALFGQWTWSKKGISPKNKDPDQSHKILQFQILKASVRAYKNNLNTHNISMLYSISNKLDEIYFYLIRLMSSGSCTKPN